MLSRILEPEVMDTSAEARDYDSMDHSQVNRLFVEDCREYRRKVCLLPDGDNAAWTALDVGTGTAQIPIEFCQQQDDCRIVAIDLAREMLRVAEENIRKAELADRVEIACQDAKDLPYADATFDAVISNSIVHHIPEPFSVMREMVRVTKPGGILFVRDLMRPENLEQLDWLVATYAGCCNAHQQKMFRESLHAALSLEEVRELVAELSIPEESVQATSDRHWTWSYTL